DEILRRWDTFAMVKDIPIITHFFGNNYYHWTTETITKLRYYENHPSPEVLIQEKYLTATFQRNLLSLTAGNRVPVVSKNVVIRVVNPFLSHESMSEDGVQWLRQNVRLPTRAGKRKIYLKRPSGGTRIPSGGGIAETPEFISILKE